MKRWIFPVLFSLLLACPAALAADSDVTDVGRAHMFDFQFLKFPLGSNPDAKAGGEKKEEEAEVKNDEQKQKEMRDKKVDDAIRKAWEEK
jgi:hypothetical protein